MINFFYCLLAETEMRWKNKLAGPLRCIGKKDFLALKRRIKIAGLLSSLGVAGKPRRWRLVDWNWKVIPVKGKLSVVPLKYFCLGPSFTFLFAALFDCCCLLLGLHCTKWAVDQDRTAGWGLTFPPPNLHYKLTFGSFDLVSSPVWWEKETNNAPLCCRFFSLDLSVSVWHSSWPDWFLFETFNF